MQVQLPTTRLDRASRGVRRSIAGVLNRRSMAGPNGSSVSSASRCGVGMQSSKAVYAQNVIAPINGVKAISPLVPGLNCSGCVARSPSLPGSGSHSDWRAGRPPSGHGVGDKHVRLHCHAIWDPSGACSLRMSKRHS